MQIDMFPATPDRNPYCFVCGKLGTRWFQPIIGTENFCSVSCVHTYVNNHRFTGQAQAIHTDECHHTTPEGATSR